MLSLDDLNWNFETEPSTTWGLSQGNRCKWARGKVLGGSSILNTVAYVRGNRRDFDQWRDIGNPGKNFIIICFSNLSASKVHKIYNLCKRIFIGWGYADVLPYFKKSEDIRIPTLLNSPFHGRGGYLGIENLRYQSPFTDIIIQAARELGIYNEDVNGFTQVGVTRTPCNLRDGLRDSMSKAFLRPAKRRPNLHISLNSQATKVLINPLTKVAEGVQFLKNISGFTYMKTVYARKEVILSAGAVQSPQVSIIGCNFM